MGRRWTWRLGLLLVILTGIGALAECVARSAGSLQTYSALFTYDAVLGYSFVAGKTVKFALGRDHYRVQFDEEGVIDRSGERPEAVVILGDGVVGGLELARERRLAALVAETGRTGAVNLAVPGYGLLQEVLRLERWLKTHGRPRVVVVIHNYANDFIDNVPEWEGTASIPGIRKRSPSEFELIPPVLPGAAYRWVAGVAKASRLYVLSQILQSRGLEIALPPQQMWLYTKRPPPEFERGVDALHVSGLRLRALAEQYRFAVVAIDWVDWPLLWRAVETPLEQQSLASARVQQATGFRSYPLKALVPSRAEVATWDQRWLIEGTRHANAAGISVVSQAIVDSLRAINE